MTCFALSSRMPCRAILQGLTVLVMGVFMSATARAVDQPLGEIARDAASACAKGDWKTAIALYTTLIERDVADPAVFYNLGTAYGRTGDTGRAVWMLLRARRLAPRDGMIRDNLVHLAPDVESQIAVFPVFPLELLAGSLSLHEWTAFAATLTILAAFGGALFFLSGDSFAGRKLTRKVTLGLTVAAAAAHGISGVKYYQDGLVSRGVITAENVYPRETPDEEGAASEFTLKPGTVIRIESAGVEGWVKAVYGAKNEVFIRRDQIEFL